MSKLQAQAQDQVTETTRAQILLDTSRAYFAVLRAEAVLKVAKQTVAARQLVADQVTALAESKLKSTLDVSFANVNLADAKLLLVRRRTTSNPPRPILPPPWACPARRASPWRKSRCRRRCRTGSPTWSDEAIAESPGAEGSAAAGERRGTLHAGRARPVLSHDRRGRDRRIRAHRPGAVPGRYGAIGMNVTIPIFNGGLFKARQAEAELKAKAADENVNDSQNRVTRDVRVAFLNATTAYDRMALTRQLLEQAAQALSIWRKPATRWARSIVELSRRSST